MAGQDPPYEIYAPYELGAFVILRLCPLNYFNIDRLKSDAQPTT